MTPAPDRLRRISKTVPPSLFVFAVALLLSFRLFALIARYSVNVLFGDQWDFLSAFFKGDPTIAELFFWQHGPPREGIGLLVDKILFPLTAWDVRSDSYLIGACIVAAMLLALYLKKRLFGRLDYSDAIVPVLFLTLAQHEMLAITPNPAYSAFPLLLLMAYLWALLQAKVLVRYGFLLIANFLLIYTGFGIFMGPVTIGLFALACYRSYLGIERVPLAVSAAGLILACVSLASFFIGHKFEPSVDCFVFPYHPLANYPWFIALMFAEFAGLRSPVVLVSILGAILLGFAAWIFALELRRLIRAASSPRSHARHLANAILLGYSLLFAANTAVGRVCLGLPAPAQSSRYTTLLIPAFLAMYFYVLTVPVRKTRDALLILLVLVVLPGHVHVPASAFYYADRKEAWVRCYKQTGDIHVCDTATAFKIYPYPERTHLQQKLDYLKKNKLNLFAE